MRKPTLKDRLEYSGVMIIVGIVRALPSRSSLRFARFLGRLAFDLFRFRRGTTLQNLRRHLTAGNHSHRHLEIGRDSYCSFAMGIAEFARLPATTMDYIRQNIVTEGLDHLDQARLRGRGAVLVTGHFGSWELLGYVLVKLGYPVKFVVGIQRNPLVQQLMNHIRHSSGIETIGLDRSLEIARALKTNHFIAMLSDQDAGRRGVFVDFMGQSSSTPGGAARLAIMMNSPIIPGFIIRTGDMNHRIVIEEPIYPDRSRDREAETTARMTQAYTEVIESYVRLYPASWLWAHRRWKTAPG
jgi:KDO2-lipid IV(A) lauroyltransferase